MRRLVKILVLLLLAATGVRLVYFSHRCQTPGPLQACGQSKAANQRNKVIRSEVLTQEDRVPQDQSQPVNQHKKIIRSEVLTQEGCVPQNQSQLINQSKKIIRSEILTQESHVPQDQSQPVNQSKKIIRSEILTQEGREPQDQSQPVNQHKRIRSEVLTQATLATQTRHGTNSKATSSSTGTCTLLLQIS